MRPFLSVMELFAVVVAGGLLLTMIRPNASPGKRRTMDAASADSATGSELVRSAKEYDTSPEVKPSEIESLVAGNTAFALDLCQSLRTETGNLFFSPHSISVAMAMVYAGAEDETERQMAKTFHFDLPQRRLHPAFNALGRQLADRGGKGLRLYVANGVWAQKGHPLLPEYLDALDVNYDAGVRLVDFAKESERSRRLINEWVKHKTQGKIADLVPPDLIHDETALVLANAVYFRGEWAQPFGADATRDGPFRLLDGKLVTAPMMRQEEDLRYARGNRCQAVELPYRGGGLAMVILLPPEGRFREFEQSLTADLLGDVLNDLEVTYVHLTLPKFKYEWGLRLKETLSAMGMPAAFGPGADFSGMDGKGHLWIDDVVHRATVSVDERGTEAAAGTISAMTYAVGATVIVDHPFVFLIRDVKSGAIVFVGRVLDPTA
jgi:serpin B